MVVAKARTPSIKPDLAQVLPYDAVSSLHPSPKVELPLAPPAKMVAASGTRDQPELLRDPFSVLAIMGENSLA